MCLSEGGEWLAHISQSSVWLSLPAYSSPGRCVRIHMRMAMPLGFTSAAERCLGAAGMLEADSLVPKGSGLQPVVLSQEAQADGKETAGWERWLVLSDCTDVMFPLERVPPGWMVAYSLGSAEAVGAHTAAGSRPLLALLRSSLAPWLLAFLTPVLGNHIKLSRVSSQIFFAVQKPQIAGNAISCLNNCLPAG